MSKTRPFDRETLLEALKELGRRCYAAGRVVEIAIYGGSAMVLTLATRPATRDVDAVFEKDRNFVRRVAAEMAEEHEWDAHWLNDGVKGWLSKAERDPSAKQFIGTYPSEDEPGLRVFIPRPEYLFAMKCRAMRVGGTEASEDIDDIKRLAAAMGIKNAAQALEIVESYYPKAQIEPKTQFGLEEIFAKLQVEAGNRDQDDG